jgi:hypothetical protein
MLCTLLHDFDPRTLNIEDKYKKISKDYYNTMDYKGKH